FRQFLAGRTRGPSLAANRLRAGAPRYGIAIGVALVAVLCVHGTLRAGRPTLSDAQSLFFNAQYNAAAALALELRTSDPDDLALWELRTSGLLFQLKGALDGHADKEKAFKQCVECP